MYWGMLMSNGLVALKYVEGQANAANYVAILKDFGVSIIRLNYKNDFIIIQDNARPHTSKVTQNFMKAQFEVLGMDGKYPRH